MIPTRIQTRFYAALALLLLGALTIAGVAAVGLETVSSHASQIYADNLITTQVTADLSTSLEEAHETALELSLTDSKEERVAVGREMKLQVLPGVDAHMAELERLHAADPPAELARLTRLATTWSQLKAALLSGGLAEQDHHSPDAADLGRLFDPMSATVASLVTTETADAREGLARILAIRRTAQLAIGFLSLGVLLVGAGAAISLVRTVARALGEMATRRSMEQEAERTQGEFTDAMQAADNEGEANDLLKRHLERVVPESSVVVLNRNNNANRLTAMTDLPDVAPLAAALAEAEPRACLAVRFGRPYRSEQGQQHLLTCQICHGLDGAVGCEPLVVSGEVIGSVLVNRAETPIAPEDIQKIHYSVGQAAPVLANLRTLASAEVRAMTDALTGMANRRAIEETLAHMVAHAARRLAPLTAFMLDLDHFKQINDGYGHAKGDEVLALVGRVMQSTLRSSDFVGRYGGEEFVALLPDTPQGVGLKVAEKLRLAIGRATVPDIDRDITASLGVATFPDDAVDAAALLREADRALYAAKANGRNRVEVAPLEDDETTHAAPPRSA